jgi:hypothetical protein
VARRLGRRTAWLASAVLAGAGVAAAWNISPAASDGGAALGDAPTYGPARLSAPPNAGAVQARIWAPGLDAGYNPQGLAVAEGSLLVSAYRSDSLCRNRGPCRVFRLDPATGTETGRFDLPPPCGHAGGVAYAAGTIFVADTRTLFIVPFRLAFQGPQGTPPVRIVPLGPGLTGSLMASDPDGVWIGSYREDGPGGMARFPVPALLGLADGQALTRGMAAAEMPIPSHAQGAAPDPDGRRMWVSRSDLGWGRLEELDVRSGALLRTSPAPGGLEGIAFDGAGRLWGVSESGARHTYDVPGARLLWPFHPVVFGLDPVRLVPQRPARDQ